MTLFKNCNPIVQLVQSILFILCSQSVHKLHVYNNDKEIIIKNKKPLPYSSMVRTSQILNIQKWKTNKTRKQKKENTQQVA
jgi:hypothetical protein